MPRQASQWKFPPFEAQEVDGYIYGRGTVDTKQLTAMELTAFLALKEKEIPLKRDVYFLATSDEESGSAYGLQWFLDHEITVGETTKTGRELFRGSDVISEGGRIPGSWRKKGILPLRIRTEILRYSGIYRESKKRRKVHFYQRRWYGASDGAC